MDVSARQWLARIRALPRTGAVNIMNVCGGHERTISQAGLRGALPPDIRLIPGPGCPVCVCPEEDIYLAIQLALHEKLTLAAYGDMLRVPVNAPKGEIRSLAQARGAGADIRAVASPLEVADIARRQPDRPVVFFCAGFETTTAPLAALLLEGVPDNLSVLLSGRLTWPAVAYLLRSDTPGFDALIAPGHVAAVMGADEWRFVADAHGLAAAVAGFTPASLLAALYAVLRQREEKHYALDNCYFPVVRPRGNETAQRQLTAVLEVVDAPWRGVGVIPASGYALRPAFAARDARRRFPGYQDDARRHAGAMPPGCDCAHVVMGRRAPDQCRLYGGACTPRQPVGPCMVSDEGACRIWWASGVRTPRVA